MTGNTTTDTIAPPPHNPLTQASTDLYVEVWGDGTPVVLVHGSLATGQTDGRNNDRSPTTATS